jgi:Oxidoreductase-like protein, N-terminal
LGVPTDPQIPKPPTPPDPQSCCQRGCTPCIFDYYDAALIRWEERIRALGLDPTEVLEAISRQQADPPSPRDAIT